MPVVQVVDVRVRRRTRSEPLRRGDAEAYAAAIVHHHPQMPLCRRKVLLRGCNPGCPRRVGFAVQQTGRVR